MKIISGKYKGIAIDGFTINGTRPTMDRVKESLFAMIQMKIKGAIVLDLFAGSGNLGLESLSNGATKVYFVDHNKIAIHTIKKNIQKLNISESYELFLQDYQKFLENTEKRFDVIFLDPPYQDKILENILYTIYHKKLLQEEGVIICEYEGQTLNTDYFDVWKEKKYGTKKITIFKQK